eukprot:8357536-Heterocapsa_arctica.AAC.1
MEEVIKEEVTREDIVEQCGAQPFGLPATNNEVPVEPVKMKKNKSQSESSSCCHHERRDYGGCKRGHQETSPR